IQLCYRDGVCNAPAQIEGGVKGQPVSATGPGNDTINLCPGFSAYLNATSNWTDTGHRYQWQMDVGSGWVNIPGANGPGYEYDGVANVDIRVIDTCANGTFTTSNTISIVISNVIYAPYATFGSAGYYMGFDNLWKTSSCLLPPFASDIPNDLSPDTYWGNSPPYGVNTWRIDTASFGTSGWPGNGG